MASKGQRRTAGVSGDFCMAGKGLLGRPMRGSEGFRNPLRISEKRRARKH